MKNKFVKIDRTPIKLPFNLKVQLKIQELENFTREDDIYNISQYYDMLTRQVLNKTFYNSLDKANPTKDKNYIHFERIYEICRLKNWDYKLYLDSQFRRAKYWVHSKYPLPNMLYSEKALKYFTNYRVKYQQKYEKDIYRDANKSTQITKKIQAEIIEDITFSTELLYRFLKNKQDKSQYKAIKIYQSWEEFSPYYLWSIPWFHSILRDLRSPKVVECKNIFNFINLNKSIQFIVRKTIKEAEEYFDIPPNIQL